MAGMLEQILRNVGELGLLKQPVRSQGMTNVPVSQGGESPDNIPFQPVSDPGVDAAGVPPPTVIKKSQQTLDAEAGDKAIDDNLQGFKDAILPQIADPVRAQAYEKMLDQARASIDDTGPAPLIGIQSKILTEIRSDTNRQQAADNAAQRAAAKLAAKEPGAYRIPREGLPPQYQYMTDADISALMRKQQEDQSQGSSGDVYPRLKGTSLKIMNDDTFKRSGLKTGDTVCIKIP